MLFLFMTRYSINFNQNNLNIYMSIMMEIMSLRGIISMSSMIIFVCSFVCLFVCMIAITIRGCNIDVTMVM